MSALPLSCFIIAFNEEDRIARAIRSVRELASEVIVVDGGSTDRTREISAAEGARIIVNPWRAFGEQKRVGERACVNDWILNLDADECVPVELAREIAELFKNGCRSPAYKVQVHIVYPGQTRPRLWARDHECVRLYNSRLVQFSASPIHDSVALGRHVAGNLSHSIYHYPIRSFAALARKYRERAAYTAEHSMHNHARWFLRTRLAFEVPVSFVRYYIGRRHLTGGLNGLFYSALTALYRFWRIQGMIGSAQPRSTSSSHFPSMNLRSRTASASLRPTHGLAILHSRQD